MTTKWKILNYLGLIFGLLLIVYSLVVLINTEWNGVDIAGPVALVFVLLLLIIGIITIFRAIKNIQKDKAQNSK